MSAENIDGGTHWGNNITPNTQKPFGPIEKYHSDKFLFEHPDKVQFSPSSFLRRADNAIATFKNSLWLNPQLEPLFQQVLADATDVNPGIVPFIISLEADWPVVIIKRGDVLTGFAPVLDGTIHAIEDIRNNLSDQERSQKFVLMIPPWTLRGTASEQIDDDTTAVVKYDPTRDDPRAYIEFAEERFWNESRRFHILPNGELLMSD